MTLGLVSLGDVEDAVDTAYSGFVFPNHKQVVGVLSPGISFTGNAVLQEGAKGYREAHLSLAALSDAEVGALLGYDETSEDVNFTDHAEVLRTVVVLSVGPTMADDGTWTADLVLEEREVIAGS